MQVPATTFGKRLRAFTTASRTRGNPCATSSAKPGDGRRIHAVRKRSEHSQ